MALSSLTLERIQRYNPRTPNWVRLRAAGSPALEALALPGEDPGRCRAFLASLLASLLPGTSFQA